MPPTKARAIKRATKRKAKGFKGIQKQFINTSVHNERSNSCVRPDGLPSTSTPIKSPKDHRESCCELDSSASSPKIGKMVNLWEQSTANLTRLSKRRYELSQDSVIDLSQIQLVISQSSICRACKNPASQLILNNDYTKRSGLAENLIITCSHCHNKTILQTSKRSGGRGGGFFQINSRSVFTCSVMKGGRESLAKFCSVMGYGPSKPNNR